MQTTLDYISANWERSLYCDSEGSGFRGIDLPYPYTSPCIRGEGHFSFFFYWDAYFTNVGLLADARFDIAKSNILNMVWFIEQQGYVPNHPAIYNRSQPAFLCRSLTDYLVASGDTDADFFARCARAIHQEYQFWTLMRGTPTGLSRHGQHDTIEGLVNFYNGAGKRVAMPPDASESEKIHIGAHLEAEAETGWDFNPRFNHRCLDFNEITINSLLYEYELFLAKYASQFGWTLLDYSHAVKLRRERITRYLWSEDRNIFLDYDFVNSRHSTVAALAGFVPLYTGVASPEQADAQRKSLPLFEREFGIAVTEEYSSPISYQWAFPNCWPPLTYMTIEGLRRYGFHADADRLAHKYLETNTQLFEHTGKLWEKTNALDGGISSNEYSAPPMMGWSAGVFLALAKKQV